LAAAAQAGALLPGFGVVEPQSDAHVDRCPGESTLPSRLITLSRRLLADSHRLGVSPAVW
jgi:hypothetical protein